MASTSTSNPPAGSGSNSGSGSRPPSSGSGSGSGSGSTSGSSSSTSFHWPPSSSGSPSKSSGSNSSSSGSSSKSSSKKDSPDPPSGFTVGSNDTTGRSFRRVSLSGLPLSDEKPQAKEETDHEPEETYVDVFDLALRHSVSDVHIPLPGNELTLGVQRVLTQDVWSTAPSLQPWNMPDRPFGTCWASNLCPHIRFNYLVSSSKSEPDFVEVFDENGTSHRFLMIWKKSYPAPGDPNPPAAPVPSFVPMPSNRTEQDEYLATLVVENFSSNPYDDTNPTDSISKWTYKFTRKFGTTLKFEKTAVSRAFSVSSSATQCHYYSRLTEVSDRFGNKLKYELDGADATGVPLRQGSTSTGLPLTLLPSRIVAVAASGTSADRKIEITSQLVTPGGTAYSLRRVVSIADPRGKVTTYTYASSDIPSIAYPGGTYAVPMKPLQSVDRPESMRTAYTYSTAWQYDSSPKSPSDPQRYCFHINLETLKDGAGLGHAFSWQHNLSVSAYNSAPSATPQGWYTKTGLPRQIQQISLVGSSALSWSSDWSKTAPVPAPEEPNTVYDINASGVFPVTRRVTDAAGNDRYWRFDQADIINAKEFDNVLFPSVAGLMSLSLMVRWKRVTFFNAPRPEGDRIQEMVEYNPRAGMAPKKATDFCGNVTEWDYGDAWSVTSQGGVSWLADLLGGPLGVGYAALLNSGFFNFYYADPTAQRKYPAGLSGPFTQSFTYYSTNPTEPAARVMKSITDEEGRYTLYDIDSTTGNRAKERVYNTSGGTLVRETTFTYDTTVKAFLTKQETNSGVLLPGGSTGAAGSLVSLVESYERDAWGYTAKSIKGDPLSGSAQHETTLYQHDANGNRTKVTDGMSHVSDFVYDDANRLVTVYFRGAGASGADTWKSIAYNARGNKITETDERGKQTTWQYDDENRPVQIRRWLNSTTSLLTQQKYDILGSLTETTDPNGNVTRFTYDALRRKTTMLQWPDASTTPSSGESGADVTRYAYDITLNAGKTGVEPAGFKPTLLTHPKSLNADGVSPPWARSKFSYDGLYRITREEHEYEANAWTLGTTTYDKVGNLLTASILESAGVTRITSHQYDALNRLLKKTWQGPSTPTDDVFTSTTYTTAGLVATTTDERGAVTAFRYDRAGRRVQELRPDPDPVTGGGTNSNSPLIRQVYNPAGNLTQSIDPLGNVTDYQYDVRNRRTREILPAALNADDSSFPLTRAEHLTQYDDAGNVTGQRDARGYWTYTEYDGVNRAVKVTAPPAAVYGSAASTAVSETTYDNNSNVLTVKDPELNVTTNAYDGLNRLIRTTVSPVSGTSSADIVNNFTYDASNNRISVTDGEGHVTRFRYDGLKRLTSTTYDAGTSYAATTQEVYGPVLRSTRIEPGSRTTSYLYDFRQRLTQVIYGTSHAENRTYAYDKAGHVTSITHPNAPNTLGNTASTYDYLGRILTELSAGRTHAYEYDKVGNRTKVTYSGGRSITSAYDAVNRLSTCTEAALFDANQLYAAAENSAPANTFGPFAAGYATSGGSYAAMPVHTAAFGGIAGLAGYTAPGGYLPCVLVNRLSTTIATPDTLESRRIMMHPGTSGEKAVLRFTAPAAGNYAFACTFRRMNSSGNGVKVEVFKGGLSTTAILSADIGGANPSTSAAWSGTRTLAAGETLDFTVGANGDYSYDSTSLELTCTRLNQDGSGSRLTGYLYDLNGNTRFKALPGGTVETREWDSRGRLLTLRTTAPGTLTWPPPTGGGGGGSGSASSSSSSSGGTIFPGNAGAVITEQSHQYDKTGNLRYILEKTPAAGDATKALPERHTLNTYDGIYRLREESVTILTSPSTNQTTAYTYDKAGNRLTMACNYGGASRLGTTTYQNGDSASTSAIYGGPSNQVRAVLRPDNTSVQYRSDAHGCRSHRWVNASAPVATIPGSGVDQLSYDRENRLISTTVAAAAPPDVTRVSGFHSFTYDARTRRVLRQAPGLTAQVCFSGGLSVQEYYTTGGSSSGSGSGSGSGSPATVPDVEYIRGNDYGGGIGGILYSLRYNGSATTGSASHYNSRGDVVCKTGADTTATVAWTASYQAFGTRPIEKGTNPDPHRANTKEEDATGLLNEGHRYRCLETGAFITRDPAGFIDGPNLYTYVHQNPWTGFDEEGLETTKYYQEHEGHVVRFAAADKTGNKPLTRLNSNGEQEVYTYHFSHGSKTEFWLSPFLWSNKYQEGWEPASKYGYSTGGTPPQSAKETKAASERSVASGAEAGTGREISRTGALRDEYASRAAKLTPGDRAGRDALKMEFRAKQTALGKEMTKKILKARAAAGHTSSLSNASKTNAGVNSAGKLMKIGGRALMAAAVATEIYNIANAPEGGRGEAAAQAGGRLGGGLAGAWVGAQIGAVGGPVGVIIGSAIGGALGAMGGEEAINRMLH